jgi:ribosomal-protein-alanine N-acetyltransferase
VGGRDEVEIAWAVAPERWGQGYATELGAAAVRVAFADLGLASVVAYTTPGNRASLRVMEKLGFEYEREVVHANLPHVLYRLQSWD